MRVKRLAVPCSLLLSIAIAPLGCKNGNKSERSGTADSVAVLKVTATSDDHCKIVLAQNVFSDSDETYTTLAMTTLLSDGSGVRVLTRESAITEVFGGSGVLAGFACTADLRKIVYGISFIDADSGRHVKENVYIHCFENKSVDSVFSEGRTYKGCLQGLHVKAFRVRSAANRLLVSTDSFIRCVNLADHTFFDIVCRAPTGLLWLTDTTFAYTAGNTGVRQSFLHAIKAENSTVLCGNDTLELEHASATETGDRILIYKWMEERGFWLGDSLCLYDSGCKQVAWSFISQAMSICYELSPSGKWVYYADGRAVRRVKVDDIRGVSMTLDSCNRIAEVVYPFPSRTDYHQNTVFESGYIVQLISVQKGEK